MLKTGHFGAPSVSDGTERKPRIDRKSKIKAMAVVVLVGLLCLFLAGVLAFTILMAWISRDLPNPNTLLSREIPQSTKIYDRTGETLLYEIHGEEKRSLVKIEDIPETMKQATIAIEDRAFYEHHGVNWMRVVKAVYVDVIERRKAQGASTLTQQLVKNAILTNEKSFTRKLKELLLALQIERQYTKDQILQMYLNEVPYGSVTYGIGSAAESYFGKTVKELTLDEVALLAAIPQAPDTYSPYGTGVRGDNRDLLIRRQSLILDAMVRDNYISKDQADEAKKIKTLEKLVKRSVGDIKAPHFVMYVRSQLIDTYGQKKVEQGGLKVITTLDWKKQEIAREELEKGVEKYGPKNGFTNAALVSLDPKNGQILAMVGSKDFFDPAIDGQVNVTIRPRQPGSSFKPIVYAAGLIKGYTPDTTLWDVFTTFKTEIGNYEPKNYSNKYYGPVSIRKALQGSLNIPAVKMLYLVGIGRVLDFAEQLGYTTLAERDRFGLSLVLGGGEVKLVEHANAYAAFAGEGTQYPIASILSVADSDGTKLEEWKQSEGKQAVPKEVAQRMSNILSDNSARAYIFNTGNYLTLPDRAVAAKTGTTNNFKDAWTMGYTPNLVAGVWVGNSSSSAMNTGADGSVVAAPIWQAYMKRSLADMPKEAFTAPPPLTTTKPILTGKAVERTVKIDKVTGKIATEFTPAELVEERKVYEGHDTLYYLDKDDPMGPAPTNPESDPQYRNWENAVQEWIKKNSWHTTSTAPTEYDDVHTKENQPTVNINNPQANESLYSRDITVQASIQALRPIVRVEIKLGDTVIAAVNGNQGSYPAHIPNTISKGYQDLTVTVIDDVGNRSTAKTTINLIADSAPISLSITAPAGGTRISQTSFPVPVSTQINELQDVKKIDVMMEQSGTVSLLGSVIAPNSFSNDVYWNSKPAIGTVVIYPVALRGDGTTVRGDNVTITIDP